MESRVRDSKPEQADFVEQFFHSLSGCETAVLTPPTAERDDDRFLESSPYVHFSRPRLPHSLLCDGKRFIREKRIVSKSAVVDIRGFGVEENALFSEGGPRLTLFSVSENTAIWF